MVEMDKIVSLSKRRGFIFQSSSPLPQAGHSVRLAPQRLQASPGGTINLLPFVASQ